MNAKWSERGREIILKLIALPVPLLRQVFRSAEGWRIFVLGLAGLIFAVIHNVLGTQTRK